MARRGFYSFHYEEDAFRASQVRNIGAIEGAPPATDNDWETITRGGDAAIKRWIDSQLEGRSVTIVLVGETTAGRKWINYEIEESWRQGMGVLGVRIHKLKDRASLTSKEGPNPFASVSLTGVGQLATRAPLKSPAGLDSKAAYASIRTNLANWIEEAITARKAGR
jgi:Thoeris protein ThsB, TIR-like domain